MFRIERTIRISSSHNLNLDYNSPCICVHGHNYKIKVGLVGNKLNRNGMLLDFSHVKKIVDELDHAHLNDIMVDNPTAENMCFFLFTEINDRLSTDNKLDGTDIRVEYVRIWETDDSWAEYRDEEVIDE